MVQVTVSTMSFSSTVDHRYRFIAAHLGGRSRTVMVTRVSYQGVENLQPMLHFEGIAKPLALDMTQRLVVSQIARSTAVSDWVGIMMELHPVEQDQRSWIEITPVGVKRQKARAGSPNSSPTLRSADPRQQEHRQPTAVRGAALRNTQPVPMRQEQRPQPVEEMKREPKIRETQEREPKARETQARETQARETQKRQSAIENSSPIESTPQLARPTAPIFRQDDIPQVSVWVPILLGILLILAFVAVYQLENNEAAWQWFSDWLS